MIGTSIPKSGFRILAVVAAAAIMVTATGRAEAQTDLGLVGVKSVYGRYLQAHYPDGEMHASNAHRNEEETWHLFEIDKAHHIYALMNWRNHQFMSKKTNKGCVPADSTTLGPTEKWYLVSGKPYGIDNAVAFRSLADGTYVGTNEPGHNDPCGGEVSSHSTAEPPRNNGGWPGWWVLEPASEPTPGRDFWNTVGRVIQGIVSKLSPADVAALLTSLAG